MIEMQYLLTALIEECGETIQAATKILRFGGDNQYPEGCGVTNETKLNIELDHITAVREMLVDTGIELEPLQEGIEEKKRRVDEVF